eukprot:3177312-Pyramimonas_sp.AAC.1
MAVPSRRVQLRIGVLAVSRGCRWSEKKRDTTLRHPPATPNNRYTTLLPRVGYDARTSYCTHGRKLTVINTETILSLPASVLLNYRSSQQDSVYPQSCARNNYSCSHSLSHSRRRRYYSLS